MSALVRAVWRGEVRLWITYWLSGVAGNMGFALVLALLYLEMGLGGRPWLSLVYAASLVWFVFIFGAIWRAAGRYPGPRLWAVLARLGVCVGILGMAAEAMALATL